MKKRILAILAGLGSLCGLANTTKAEPLEIGKTLPEVEGLTHKGTTIQLHKAAANGWALFFFSPKAATPG